MKDLVIYCEKSLINFLSQLLSKQKIIFKKIEDLEKNLSKENIPSVVFNNNQNKSSLPKSFIKPQNLLFVETQDIKITNISKEHKIKAPLKVESLKNNIENFLSNTIILYKDLKIINKIILNKKNNISCNLTDIENEILLYLIRNKNCSKIKIKKNILKINSNVDTSSLDSHLTRIRKKLEKIETKIKIQSKGDNLYIL